MKNKGVLRYSGKKNKVFSFGEKLVLICLFLMSMDFYNKYSYLAFCAAGLFVIQRRSMKLPAMSLAVWVLSMSLCFLSPHARSLTGMIKPFVFPLCLLIGYNMTDEHSANREIAVERIIVVLALGAFAHFAGDMILNWGVAEQRNTIDIWTMESMAATRQAGLSCIMIAVTVSWLFSEKSKLVKLFAVLILASVLYYNFTLATRTIVIQLAAAVIMAVIFRFLFEKKGGKRLKVLFFTLAGGLLLLFVMNTEWFASMFEGTVFYDRFFAKNAYDALEEDQRMTLKLKFLERMWEYPFGGLHIRTALNEYAHDILLDTYDEAGIFALGAVICILVDAVVKLVRICRNSQISKDLRTMLLCVITVIFLEFMVEPILEGLPWLLAVFCVIYGAMGRLCYRNE